MRIPVSGNRSSPPDRMTDLNRPYTILPMKGGDSNRGVVSFDFFCRVRDIRVVRGSRFEDQQSALADRRFGTSFCIPPKSHRLAPNLSMFNSQFRILIGWELRIGN